jgi:hypothetical protein
MATIDYSQTIIRLIRDDIRNIKLVSVLSRYYKNASNYRLNLHEAVFDLMELSDYSDYEELKNWYFQKMENAKSASLDSLNEIAIDIYAGLKMKYHGKN